MIEQWVTYFPFGDHTPDWAVFYGPFDSLEEAQAHARTLSTDPDEGKVARLVRLGRAS